MDRKNFLKTGACACTVALFAGSLKLSGQEAQPDAERKFIADWVEEMMQILDANVDEQTKEKMMEAAGKGCATRGGGPIMEKFKGNPQGLIDLFKKEWAETAVYDEEEGVILLGGKPGHECFCPLAKTKKTFSTKTFCLCSRGWMKTVFSAVLQKPVQAELESSVLTGGDRCLFKIIIPK